MEKYLVEESRSFGKGDGNESFSKKVMCIDDVSNAVKDFYDMAGGELLEGSETSKGFFEELLERSCAFASCPNYGGDWDDATEFSIYVIELEAYKSKERVRLQKEIDELEKLG